MNQEKIGKFIAECRKENNLTQEQLAEKLNITRKAISKWETGNGLPDVSIMQELCDVLKITLNELFNGEKIPDENYKKVADENLLCALENSAFTLKDRVRYYRKKWLKEHIFDIVTSITIWILIVVVLKFKGINGHMIVDIAVISAIVFYVFRYNQMKIYIENRAYNKIEK